MTQNFRDKLYNFITDYIEQYDHSPAFAEITAAMHISPRSKSLITRSLRALAKEGKLLLTKDGRRLLISLPNQKKLPLLGRISAGVPIEAIVDNQFIDVAHWFNPAHCFALQVEGTSMIDEGILDGDLIICKGANTAHEHDIVVALIDEHHVTLKRISYKLKGMITLIPANPTLKPRAYAKERITIQGIYVGLVRLHS